MRRPEDVAAYGEGFAAFWGGGRTRHEVPLEISSVELATDDDGEADEGERGEDEQDEGETLVLRYSAHEVLARKDFTASTPAELAETYRLIAALRARASLRPSRRLSPSRRSGARLDLRRTVRRAIRSGGEAVVLHRLVAGRRPRRVVLLVDVSGSMAGYARAMLRFAHAAVAGPARVETFTFGTRLTRVTRELSWRDPDKALERFSGAVDDMSGGTRLGASLRSFNDRWGSTGIARGAVVVIMSDGWDRGDPEEVAAEMARLSRLAYRIVWVNPLKATPGYAPLARGMAAAIPYVDEFVEGHSLDALERLVEVIAR